MPHNLEIAISKKRDEINSHYLRFTRQARGNPPPHYLYEELKMLEDKLKEKKESKKKVGKPAFYSQPMERINVMLDPETIAFYKKVGGGNLSEGIRRHWRGLTPLALDTATPSDNEAALRK